jgi:hypothetical protein
MVKLHVTEQRQVHCARDIIMNPNSYEALKACEVHQSAKALFSIRRASLFPTTAEWRQGLLPCAVEQISFFNNL